MENEIKNRLIEKPHILEAKNEIKKYPDWAETQLAKDIYDLGRDIWDDLHRDDWRKKQKEYSDLKKGYALALCDVGLLIEDPYIKKHQCRALQDDWISSALSDNNIGKWMIKN